MTNNDNSMKATTDTNTQPVHIEQYLREKREEIIFALSCQDYTEAQIGRLFRLPRSYVHKILKKKPEGYSPKWVKKKAE